MRDVVIVDSVRTGLAKAFRGSFNLTRSDDMLAHCIDGLLDRNGQVAPDEVEDVVVGAASHAGEQDGGENGAAHHHLPDHDRPGPLVTGGIFAWHNGERALVRTKAATDFVHPYNSWWGGYLQRRDKARYRPE